MMSFTLPDLIAELQRSPYQHRLTMTNVEQVTSSGADLILETDVSNLQSQLDDANDSIANYERSERDSDDKIRELESKIEEREEELTKLRDLMAELKDPDSGVTVATCLERTAAAEKSEAEWQRHAQNRREHAEKCQAELTALRKRKGVEPELFANGKALIEIVRELAHDKAFASHALRVKAENLCARIHGTTWHLR